MPRFLTDKRTPIPKVKKRNYELKRHMKQAQKDKMSETVCMSIEPSYTFDGEKGVATLNCGNYVGSEIEIPSSIEKDGKTYRVEIGLLAFRDCYNLREIVLPEGVEILLRSTFWDCHNLERVVIPSTVRMILPCQFIGCENMKEIIFQNPEGIKWHDAVFCGLSVDDVKVIDQSKSIEYSLGEFISKYNPE